MNMFYKTDFSVQGEDSLQMKLNLIYNYKDDLSLQVMHRKRLNLFCKILDDLKKKNLLDISGQALDIGCNGGVYSKILSDYGFRKVVGIDLDEDTHRIAIETFKEDIEQGRISFELRGVESISETPEFSFVLCTEVIEHTDDPDASIAMIRKAMKPGAIAIISLPNSISLGYGMEYLKKRLLGLPIGKELHSHLQYPFWKTLRIFKSSTQFRMIKSTGTNLFLFKIILNLLKKQKKFLRFLNKSDSFLSTIFPFKFFTQFFFVVIERKISEDPHL
jgi:2-polyprenyl-3-methyl-5-hydroxy-6-metoxy-1,4-benzoquinol methylase